MERIIKIVQNMKDKKVLVVGDVMLDKYIWGEVKRISPEAPVQVVDVKKESYMPGGAGNAAHNIASLQGVPYLVGIVGNDKPKEILEDFLKSKCINTDGIIQVKNIPTIQKIRIIAKSQQLLRIDYEEKITLTKSIEEKIITYITNIIDKIDIILVSDYSKGIVNQPLMIKIIELSKQYNKKVIIDPKPKNKEYYKGCYLITPNVSEAIEMSSLEDDNIAKIGKKLMEDLQCNVLITRSEEGMDVIEKNKEIIHIPTKAKEVYDVSGAGDTTVAALSLAIAAGASLQEAAFIANHAAGITVGKIGTSTVSLEELEESIKNDK